MAKHIIKLDKEREIKFTMNAILALDELFQINVYSRATYDDFPPAKMMSLIWAGQMHTKNALKRSQIPQYVPTAMADYMSVCLVIAEAILDATKDPTKEAADAK